MMINRINPHGVAALLRPAFLLGVGGALGVWLGTALENQTQLFLAATAFVLTLLVAVGWQARAHGQQRWQGIWNAYAEREIAQDQRRDTLLRR
jgi:hypothetical protein